MGPLLEKARNSGSYTSNSTTTLETIRNMVRSRRFKVLVVRLDELRGRLLPPKFSQTGQYSAAQYDMAKAYVLLVHAEVEAFLEDRSREKAKKLEKVWRTKARRTKGLRRLIQAHNIDSRHPWKPIEWSTDRVQKALNFYFGLINTNNGIKELDIFKLFYPLGVGYESLDATWLANMNSFGVVRGSFAHGSIKTHQPVDPQNELNKVKQLVKGLSRLDRKIRDLG